VSGNLTYIDTDDQGEDYRGVWGDGTYIYAACGADGLRSYSADGSGNLTYIDTDDQGGTYYGIWGDGTYIYVVSFYSGVLSYSVGAVGTPPVGGTISSIALSVTPRVIVEKSPITGIAIDTVTLQWAPGETGGAWQTLYSWTGADLAFDGAEYAFGHDLVNHWTLPKDELYRLRLYIAGGVYENADLADDTTGDGTNGWRDQWIVLMKSHATERKPPRATWGW
jgi:hypothetical protein